MDNFGLPFKKYILLFACTGLIAHFTQTSQSNLASNCQNNFPGSAIFVIQTHMPSEISMGCRCKSDCDFTHTAPGNRHTAPVTVKKRLYTNYSTKTCLHYNIYKIFFFLFYYLQSQGQHTILTGRYPMLQQSNWDIK